ncbi:MAG TPA: N-acetylglucosamine kinase [Daejeonella sp.]|nr:N-acetylglucosamine kinase [Daejeonella sp.]
MILVADSGSSKADWILTFADSKQLEFRTSGINPFFLSEKEIIRILNQVEVLQPYRDEIKEVYFFGAGCSSPDRREIISNALSKVFSNSFISVENDLLAAVYASCGNTEGLSCILGTGSNITYFDGANIHPGKHGLGYVLGDEGSGTYFGRKIITAYLYGTMPQHLQKDFDNTYKINKDIVLKNIYDKPAPNFYLASFAKFLSTHAEDPYIQELLTEGFEEFVQTNIQSHPNYTHYKCNFVGSIAFHFQDVLKKVCARHHVKTGKILKHPIEELTQFILDRESKHA